MKTHTKKVKRDKQTTTWWWAGPWVSCKYSAKNTWCSRSRPILYNYQTISKNLIRWMLWIMIFVKELLVQPVSIELSEAGAVLNRSPVWLSRTPVRERCHLWCGSLFSKGLLHKKRRRQRQRWGQSQRQTSHLSSLIVAPNTFLVLVTQRKPMVVEPYDQHLNNWLSRFDEHLSLKEFHDQSIVNPSLFNK